jgi:Putative zinc-finger
MSHSCAEWRGDIGAYIIGALNGRERALVSRHLAECVGCRADYDDLVPVRAWLGQLAPATKRPDTGRAEQPGSPPHASLPADPHPNPRLDAVPVPHSRRESGTWSLASPPGRLRAIRLRPRWGLLAAAAAAAVLAALVVSGPSARSFHAVDSTTGVSGHAQLHGTPTGTQIDLTANGLPGGQRCILVAVARSNTDIAGTWDATYDGSARIAGTSGFPASQLTALRVESDTGVVLLSIRVWP